MAIIKLIVTGRMEEGALAQSLKKYFPTERINSQGVSEPVEWAKPRRLNGATSHQVGRMHWGMCHSQFQRDQEV